MGQGNGAGPPVWAVVSTRMFQVLKKLGYASTLSCPISHQQMKLCGFAFVDNSDIIATSNTVNDPESTLQQMQHTLDCWESVAKTTGGAIKAEKSWSYLVYFTWNKGIWSYGKDSSAEDLTTLDHLNSRTSLTNLPPNKAKKMLGVWLCPDGNQIEQKKYLTNKTTQLAEYMRVGHIQRHEAWIALTMIAQKSVEYCLPVTSFSKRDIEEIMSPLYKIFLPKSGLNRNT